MDASFFRRQVSRLQPRPLRTFVTLAAGFLMNCTSTPPTSVPPAVQTSVPHFDASDNDDTAPNPVLRQLAATLAVEPATAGAVGLGRNGTDEVAIAGHRWADGPAIESSTQFNLASVSKVLTAARILTLAHEGKLNLRASLAEYLPGVRLLGAGGKNLAESIMLLHLVVHESGLPHIPPDLEAKVAGRWGEPSLLTLLTDDWEIQLVADPGGFRYSNLGYALLGAVIERIDGHPFADAMGEFLPGLGMPQATYLPKDSAAAYGHAVGPEGVAVHQPDWYASRYAMPFNGLWASVPELLAFGHRLIEAQPHSPLYPLAPAEGPAFGLFRAKHPSGFDGQSVETLEHDGSGPGFMAYFIIAPSEDLVIAAMTNGGGESSEESKAFSTSVLRILSNL